MITRESIRVALSALRYHNRLASEKNCDYLGSSLEENSLEGISALSELLERMTESDQPDFLGGEL